MFHVPNLPQHIAAAQVVKQNLAKIGLDVEIKPGLSRPLLQEHRARSTLGHCLVPWIPIYMDPYEYLNVLFDPSSIGAAKLSFNSRNYNRLLRQAARKHGAARYREYAELDIKLARDAAPLVPLYYLKEPTFVSKRVDPRCIVLRPFLDLTTVCLKR